MSSPKQVGFLRLKNGSLGDNTFYKSKDGYRVKTKKTISNNRFKNDPKFARTRENAEDFGTSATSAKFVRLSVNHIVRSRYDSTMFRRLNSLMSKIMNMDHISPRGKSIVRPEYTKALLGFEMNSNCSLKSVFNTRFSTSINRDTGAVGISIPSFIPTDRVHAPKGSTHYTIVATASAIVFVNKKFNIDRMESEKMEINERSTEQMDIALSLPPNTTQPVFVFLGLQFTQEIPGRSYEVAKYKMNPLCIVAVFNE